MTWAGFYLVCFLVGLMLSVFGVVSGSVHLPHGHFHFGHGHAAGGLSKFNFATIMAFLAWFGGAGYLLTVHEASLGMWIVVLATVFGFIGGAIVFGFMTRILMKDTGELDPADYDKIGVLGQITNPDPRGRHRRADIRAGRCAPGMRRAQRERRRHREGNGSCGDAVRQGNCLRTALG